MISNNMHQDYYKHSNKEPFALFNGRHVVSQRAAIDSILRAKIQMEKKGKEREAPLSFLYACLSF